MRQLLSILKADVTQLSVADVFFAAVGRHPDALLRAGIVEGG